MTASMLHYDAFDAGSMDNLVSPAPDHDGANVSVRDLTRLLHVEFPGDKPFAVVVADLAVAHRVRPAPRA